MDSTAEIVKKFNDELIKVIQTTLIVNGVERSSDLVKTIKLEKTNNGFQMIANDYYTYVSTGRRKRVRKVPIRDLIKWMKEVGIKTKNVNS